jgi:hypothetical protein
LGDAALPALPPLPIEPPALIPPPLPAVVTPLLPPPELAPPAAEPPIAPIITPLSLEHAATLPSSATNAMALAGASEESSGEERRCMRSGAFLGCDAPLR